MMDAEWFLIEIGMYGEIFENGYNTGMQTHVHSLEKMNTYIHAFNGTGHPNDKKIVMGSLASWREENQDFRETIAFLKNIEEECDVYLSQAH
jgi:hypothetical protein